METTSGDFRNMDELVFEKRNKLYGAYRLRTSYDGNVVKSFIGAHILAALVMLAFLLDRGGDEHVVKAGMLPDLTDVIKLDDAIKIETPQKPQRPIVRRIQHDHAMPTRVTPDEVIPPTTDDQIEPYVAGVDGLDDTNADVGDNTLLVGNGEGTEPAIVPPTEPIVMGIQATYKGGAEAMVRFLKKKLHQPRTTPLAGVVYVQFVVNSKGDVVDIQVIKGIHPAYDKEAVRVVSLMEDWEPAMQNNRPVSVRMVLPFKFTLPQ